jgi:hypothetical protein
MEGGTMTALPFHDRVILAYEECRLVFERRDGFLSDDSVLDVAEAWTTDDLHHGFESDDPADWPSVDDYERLRDSLFELLTVEAGDEL